MLTTDPPAAAPDDGRPETRRRVDLCVAFVDLAGFTALTQAHGDDYAADVHDAFVAALALACQQSPGVVCVKHLGDGALLTAPDSTTMLTALVAGVRDQSDAELCLRVRAGVTTGPVLQVSSGHGPDVLGHTVNVAARLCALAAPGELLLSDRAARSGGQPIASARPLGPRLLRHVTEPVDVWSVPLGAQDSQIDPVCHMTVSPGAITVVVGGLKRRFCSTDCRDAFVISHG